MFSLSSRTAKWTLAVVMLPAGLIAGFMAIREPTQPLTADALRAARDKWRAAGVDSYDMEFTMAGGTYHVEVRRGQVHQLTRDGQPTTSHRLTDFTVVGLFDTLERELEALNDPRNPFGGDRATTLLRVRFHPRFGYVQRYLRAVGGTGKSQAIEVVRFDARP